MKLSKHLDNILTMISGYITIANITIHVEFLKIYRFSRATILDILLLTFSDIQSQNKCGYECWRRLKLKYFKSFPENLYFDSTLTALCGVFLRYGENWHKGWKSAIKSIMLHHYMPLLYRK